MAIRMASASRWARLDEDQRGEPTDQAGAEADREAFELDFAKQLVRLTHHSQVRADELGAYRDAQGRQQPSEDRRDPIEGDGQAGQRETDNPRLKPTRSCACRSPDRFRASPAS